MKHFLERFLIEIKASARRENPIYLVYHRGRIWKMVQCLITKDEWNRTAPERKSIRIATNAQRNFSLLKYFFVMLTGIQNIIRYIYRCAFSIKNVLYD